MRVNALSSTLYTVTLLISSFNAVNAHHGRSALSRRSFDHGFFGPGNIFGGGMFTPPNRPPVKKPPPKPEPTPSNSFDLSNIQGDIIFPIDSAKKTFLFFKIDNPGTFKGCLSSSIHDRITTAAQVSPGSQPPSAAINIGFTIDGLNALGVTDNLGDRSFSARQTNDVNAMGDPGTTNWVQAFTGQNVHGIFMVGASSKKSIDAAISDLLSTTNGSISEVYRLEGSQRPKDQAGHEHFGFKDGLSQPCLDGMTDCSQPGIAVMPPGVILIGANGDITPRPSWASGGSMMAFRQLKQLVPEFQKFARDNAIKMPGMTQDQGAELLQARMFGRWKDGTPLDLSPLKPDPTLAADSSRNNDFTYSHPNSDLSSDQSRCPFSAHTRKTNPRDDLPNNSNHIMRSSIAYGSEVTQREAKAQTTQQDRGLAFVAYQSSIANGFLFQQQSWADATGFPLQKNQTIGFDAVIGSNHGQPRVTFGLDPTDASKSLTLPDFIVSEGGAYFFYPPLSALATGGKLAQ